jgi:uncharacterized protein YhaN
VWVREIFIDGFGVFATHQVTDIGSGLTLFVGENEAGKSTLLAFLRMVLFGFPDGRSRENVYPPLHGGRHGGRITLQTSGGARHVVERWQGPRGGPVTVTSTDGGTGGEEMLRQILGGTTRDLFRNVYAFSLSELQSFETLQGDAVKAALYGASAGAAVLALPKIETAIEQALGSVFKPGGSNPLLNQKLAEFEDVRAELREALGTIDRFNETVRKLGETDRNISEALEHAKAMSRARQEHDITLRLWPKWISLQQLRDDLERLPVATRIAFPEDGIQRLEKLVLLRDGHTAQLAVTEATLQELEGHLNALKYDVRVLQQTEALRRLRDGAATYRERLEGIPVLQQGKLAAERELQHLLEELGPDWTLQRARDIDRSLFTREAIRTHQALFATRQEEHKTAETLAETSQEALEKAVHAEALASKTLDAIRDPGLPPDTEAVRALQSGRQTFSELVRELPMLRAQLTSDREELVRLVHSIQPEWRAAHIEAFDLSVAARTRIDEHETAISKAQEELAHARAKVRTTEEAAREAETLRQRITHDLEGLPVAAPSRADILQRRGGLRELRGILVDRADTEAELRRQNERLRDKQEEVERLARASTAEPWRFLPKLSWGAVLIAVVAGAALLVSGQRDPALVVTAIFLAAAAAAALLNRVLAQQQRSTRTATEQIRAGLEQETASIRLTCRQLEETFAQHRRTLEERAQALGVPTPKAASDIDAAENRTDVDLAAYDQRAAVTRDLESAQESMRHATSANEDAVTQAGKCGEDVVTANKNWQSQLQIMGLPLDVSPRTVATVLLPRIASARDRIRNLSVSTSKLTALEETCQQYLVLAVKVQAVPKDAREPSADLLSAVDRFLEAAAEADKTRAQRSEADRLLRLERSRREQAEKQAIQARETLDTARGRQEQARQSWRDWLNARGLQSELSPETALDALDTISQVTQKGNQLGELELELHELGAQRAAYEELAATTFKNIGRPVPSLESLPTAVQMLAEEYDEGSQSAVRQGELSRQRDVEKAKLNEAQTHLAEVQRQIQTLFEAAGTADEEGFRRRGHVEAERSRLSSGITAVDQTLMEISGERDLDVLKARLECVTLAETQAKLVELDDEIHAGAESLEKLRQTKAVLDQEKATLASADDIARLRADQERIRAEIARLASEWSRYAIARHLLQEAKRRFEKEGQPRVLRDASRFFGLVTGGRYTEVRATLGARDGALDVIRHDQARRRPEELSRGTQEQLYLALRFGYIVNHLTNGEPLPLIMDEILVNFDPRRGAQAARAILDLAQTYQILFFTCHNWARDMFHRHDPTVRVIPLDAGAKDWVH